MKRLNIFILILTTVMIFWIVGCESDMAFNSSADQQVQPTLAKKAENGSHRKATGNVGWYAGGAQRYADFNAHDNAPGNPSDRGSLYYIEEAPGETSTFKAALDYVDVFNEFEAKFSGTMIETTGRYKVGTKVYGWVKDGGTPGAGNDYVQFNSSSSFWSSSGPAYVANGGNLQVHY